jgi:MSHA biogenesis protein MshI
VYVVSDRIDRYCRDENSVLSILKSPKLKGVQVGVMIGDRFVAMATVRRRAGERPIIEHCALHRCERDESVERLLQRVLAKHGGSRPHVVAVLAHADYQLVQVEAPEVQPAELRAAIRWRLRDVINFHIDDAVVDVFQIPDQSRRAQAKMLFAVAARSAAVQRVVNALEPIAKHFDVIDVPELCLRNLGALLIQDLKGVATLLLHENAAQLVLTRQGVLYMARHIEYNRGLSLDSNELAEGPPIDAASFALELQRSLDYYESHYDQTPITDLVIAPANERAMQLAENLRAETSVRVSVLDLSTVVQIATSTADSASEQADQHVGINHSPECLLALGAALRHDTTEL